VIHLDPWWNPAAESQATARAHRIGQQNPVTVYRLVAKGTIEGASSAYTAANATWPIRCLPSPIESARSRAMICARCSMGSLGARDPATHLARRSRSRRGVPARPVRNRLGRVAMPSPPAFVQLGKKLTMPLKLTLTEGVLPRGTEKATFVKLCQAMLKWHGLTDRRHRRASAQ